MPTTCGVRWRSCGGSPRANGSTTAPACGVSPRSGRKRSFWSACATGSFPLQRDRIAYCYTSNEKVTACDFDGETYPLDKTLEALQALLPERDFFRANRQFIVARRAVKEIAVWFGSRLTLHLTVDTPERIVISKARVPEFKTWLRAVHPAE